MDAVHMRDNGYRRRLRRWKCISLRIQNSPIILMVRYVECRRRTKGDSGRYSCHHDKQTLATVVTYLVCVFEHREVSTLVRHHSNVTLYDNQAGGELCPAAGHSVRLLYQRVRSDQLYESYSFEANVTCL